MPIFLDTRGRTKVAIGICARCSCKLPYDDLIPDPNYPGLYVCSDDVDQFDPYRLPARETENITLDHARPDVHISSPGPSPDLVADPLDVTITEIGFRTTWQPNTPYARSASVTPMDINSPLVDLPQNWFVCLIAGTSGSTSPNWNVGPGSTVIDGTVTWLQYGPYPN